jgi:KDO2-lipid IV(A) lauroyltransferase
MGTLLRLLSKIPYRWLAASGSLLGWVVWALHVRRGVVMSNLALAFPEKGEAERRAIARRTFLNLGRMITD